MKIIISLIFLFQEFSGFGSGIEISEIQYTQGAKASESFPLITDPGTNFAQVALHNVDSQIGQFYLKTHILTPLFNQPFNQCVTDTKKRKTMHEQYAIAYLNARFIVDDPLLMQLLREGDKNGWSPASLNSFEMINWILSGKNKAARAKILEAPILKYILPQVWFLNKLPVSCALLSESIEQQNIQALQIILKLSSYAPNNYMPSRDQIAYGLESATFKGWEQGVQTLIAKMGDLDSVMLGHIEAAMAHAAIQGHISLMRIFIDKIGTTDHAALILHNTLKSAATNNCIRSVYTLLQLDYFKKTKHDLNEIASLTTNRQIADMIRMQSIKPSCFCSFL